MYWNNIIYIVYFAMKKYYLASLILHLIPLVLLAVHKIPKPQEQPVEVTVIENGGNSSNKDSDKRKKNIIDLGDDEGKSVDKGTFYWGIGVSTRLEILQDGTGRLGYYMEEVHMGYPAYDHGILPGDVIFSVNGGAIGEIDDVSGDGPKTLTLLVLRNNITLTFVMDRAKIFY